MKRRLLTGAIVFALALVMSFNTVKAQTPLMDANVSITSGNAYTPLSTWIWETTYPYYYTYVGLTGFPFMYDNQTWSTITMWGSGGIGFQNYNLNVRYPYYYGSEDWMGYPGGYYYYYNPPSVFALWSMQDYYSSGSFMRIGVTGAPGSRVCTFEWTNMKWYYGYYHSTCNLNYQIKLYETSWNIELCYGTVASDNDFNGNFYVKHPLIGFFGFNGTTSANWINVDPNSPTPNASCRQWEWYKAAPQGPGNGGGGHSYRSAVMTKADCDAILLGDIVQLNYGAQFKVSAPEKDSILIRGYIYGNGSVDMRGIGDGQRPKVQIKGIKYPGANSVRRTISGPMTYPVHANFQIIYDATITNLANDVLTNFTNATPGAGNNYSFGPGGVLDLLNNQSLISGGVYQLKDTLDDGVGANRKGYENHYLFNIALTNDIEISGPIDPKTLSQKRYPLSARVPVKVKYTNRGVTPISTFSTTVRVFDMSNVELWSDTQVWTALPGQELQLGKSVDIVFNQYRPLAVALYKFTATVTMLGDEESFNNTWPWAGGSSHIFEVASEIEAEALSILKPKNVDELTGLPMDIFVGRPIRPKARYQNNGMTDISNAPTTMTITRTGQTTPIYTSNGIISSIPQGIRYNQTDFDFADIWTPPSAGSYTATVTVNVLDDGKMDNNTVSQVFTVIDAMNGVYTIGPDRAGTSPDDILYNSRNFTAVADAISKLYLKGLTGPVIFEFTTNNYTVGSVFALSPSIDLRSKIVGMSDVNTVTFRPSTDMAVSTANVKINLQSGSGIGIILGQSTQTFNPNSVVDNVPLSMRKPYANPQGSFIFDGGNQRALEFTLTSAAKLNAVFYLAQGASNVTIKNCIIKNDNPSIRYANTSLPLTKFNNPEFVFDQDSRSTGTLSYSTGIILRSIAPSDGINYFDPNKPITPATNSRNIDTLINQNNVIQNNEISGFAYGIVSLGIGPLIRNGVTTRYYNKNNSISNNLIHDVSRAGIYFGHEENSTISGNKIWGVANATTSYNAGTDVGGILLGGEKRLGFLGYNNIGISLTGNEISNIGQMTSTANNIYGIRVEQSQNAYVTNGTVYPNVDESTLIMNNAIWGIRTASAAASRFGIRLFTERNTTLGGWYAIMTNPVKPAYFTTNDRIVNNTVIMDADIFATTGVVAGIGVQNANAPVLLNNAIAMKDDNPIGNTNEYAAIFYQGYLPTTALGIVSDRNAFWLRASGTPADSAAIYRVIEIDNMSKIIYAGIRNEFMTMNQWQMYTGKDFNSVLRDFTADLTSPDITSNISKLRVNNAPDWPIGSSLNNRGERLSYVTKDIDGNDRGVSNQSYDLGAFEFPGRMNNSDLEITTSRQPGAYKASSGTFSDAEYIMTTAPIEVKAVIRNNGSLPQTGVMFTVKIYRQKPNSAAFYDSPEVVETIISNIITGESKEIVFNLADKVGKEFYPKTYGQWNTYYGNRPGMVDSLYTVPGWYSTMFENVTPIYRIEITGPSDENPSNNLYRKDVRFYLKRSFLDMLISAENSCYDLTSGVLDADILAGHRNYDSLKTAIRRIGWNNAWVKEAGKDTILSQSYDVFERSAWEPRAINYSMYTSLLWSDGDENALTRQEVLDITRFAESGSTSHKKNLLIGSQEMVRANYASDSTFVKSILRATFKTYTPNPINPPVDPLGGASYFAGVGKPTRTITDNTKWIVGNAVGRLLQQYILKTGAGPNADADPIPGLMGVSDKGEGLARPAYNYNTAVVVCPLPKETTMGVATTSITRNVVYLGVDWRHFENAETILRACLDFLAKNGGQIIPVDLISFNAVPYENRVELTWETGGEFNSDRFEVERASISETGKGSFAKVAEEAAAGRSNVQLSYGPVIDKTVEFNRAYIYRLKMIDKDGSFKYSDEVEVVIGGNDGVWLGTAVPNPASYQALVQISLKEASNIELSLFDMAGKLVKVFFSGLKQAGTQEIMLELNEVPSGSYNYVLNVNNRMYYQPIRIVR